VARIERAEYDFNLRARMVPPPDPDRAKDRTEAILAESRKRYACGLSEVQAELEKTFEIDQEPPRPEKRHRERVQPEVTVPPEAQPTEPDAGLA
jgi:hypothetical protein